MDASQEQQQQQDTKEEEVLSNEDFEKALDEVTPAELEQLRQEEEERGTAGQEEDQSLAESEAPTLETQVPVEEEQAQGSEAPEVEEEKEKEKDHAMDFSYGDILAERRRQGILLLDYPPTIKKFEEAPIWPGTAAFAEIWDAANDLVFVDPNPAFRRELDNATDNPLIVGPPLFMLVHDEALPNVVRGFIDKASMLDPNMAATVIERTKAKSGPYGITRVVPLAHAVLIKALPLASLLLKITKTDPNQGVSSLLGENSKSSLALAIDQADESMVELLLANDRLDPNMGERKGIEQIAPVAMAANRYLAETQSQKRQTEEGDVFLRIFTSLALDPRVNLDYMQRGGTIRISYQAYPTLQEIMATVGFRDFAPNIPETL